MTRTKLQSNFSDIQYLKAVPPDEVVDMTSKLTVGESVDVKPSKGEVSPVVSPHQENHNEEQTIPPQPESGRSISGTASPGSRPPTVVSEINI